MNQIIDKVREDKTPPEWDPRGPATDLLNFGDLLPDALLHELILARIADVHGARLIFNSKIRML